MSNAAAGPLSDSAAGSVFGRSISILAVGTEVVEGQVIDRNSAWIARECGLLGFAIASHRAVPDDRAMIRAAIDELRRESRTIFVTGGLGPTSDDFTRELIADAFAAPLAFDEGAWAELAAKLEARGLRPRDAQRRQCWFPRGARILPNPAGTANGFCLFSEGSRLFALPGPPLEVAAVFEASLRAELRSEVRESERVDLRIWRCLGRGESDLAEVVERAMAGSGLTLGYRAHLPYVEVKAWVPRAQAASKKPWLDALEGALAPWLVNRDDEDVADAVVLAAKGFPGGIRLLDAATEGLLLERLAARSRVGGGADARPALAVETFFGGAIVADLEARAFAGASRPGLEPATILVALRERDQAWVVAWRADSGASIEWRDVIPPFNYKLGSERGRKYICERALRLVGEAWAAAGASQSAGEA